MCAKLTDASLRVMLRAVKQEDVVDRILNSSSNTDDKGLTLVHYAVELFVLHCRVSSDEALLSIRKIDRGSNKTFSRLPEVVEQKLGNVWDFNAHGNSEKPDGAYRLQLEGAKGSIYRGLVVEIDGDDGKINQPRQTATKMWEHLMYSKLTAGGGASNFKTNGFTMRINMARAEVSLPQDDAVLHDYIQKPGRWMQNNEKFWQIQCVNVLCNLLGSVVFCLRDIVMCMAQRTDSSDENWLFHQYHNAYHVNMFIGPFDINVQDCTVDINNVREIAKNNCEEKRGASKTKFRKEEMFGDLGWTVDFVCVSRAKCGHTRVQYVLVENFQGHMVTPINPGDGQNLKSVSTPKEHKLRMNRGLMTLIDILNTKNVFLLGGIDSTQIPNWKRKKYTGSAARNLQTETQKKYFNILGSMCSLMENVLLYEIRDGVKWRREHTWPMRKWMDEISYRLHANPHERGKPTRADHIMTLDPSAANPQSLVRKLKKSLSDTLPQLNQELQEYMKKEGFNNIRDAELYLRLVGVTNVLALDQLASTHSIILDNDKYHARVFHGLSVGTQSEMRMMFERIVLNPRTEKELLKLFSFTAWVFPQYEVEVEDSDTGTDSHTRKIMRYYIEFQLQNSFKDNRQEWNSDTFKDNRKICSLLILHAKFFFTHGVCSLAQMFQFGMNLDQYKKHIREMFSKQNEEQLNIRNGFFEIRDDDDNVVLEAGNTIVENIINRMSTYLFRENAENEDLKTKEFKTNGVEEVKEYRYISSIDNLKEFFTENGCNDTPFDQMMVEDSQIPICEEICLGHMRLRQFIYLICRNIGPNDPRFTSSCLRYISSDIVIPGVDGPDKMSDTVLPDMPKKMMFFLLAVLSERDQLQFDSTRLIFPKALKKISQQTWCYIKPCIDVVKRSKDHADNIKDMEILRDDIATPIFMLYFNFKKNDLKFQEIQTEVEDIESEESFEGDSDSD